MRNKPTRLFLSIAVGLTFSLLPVNLGVATATPVVDGFIDVDPGGGGSTGISGGSGGSPTVDPATGGGSGSIPVARPGKRKGPSKARITPTAVWRTVEVRSCAFGSEIDFNWTIGTPGPLLTPVLGAVGMFTMPETGRMRVQALINIADGAVLETRHLGCVALAVATVDPPLPPAPPSPAAVEAAAVDLLESKNLEATIMIAPGPKGLAGMETDFSAAVGDVPLGPLNFPGGYSVSGVAKPLSYEWDLGDGELKATNVPSVEGYIYEKKGAKKIVLSVVWGGSYTVTGPGVNYTEDFDATTIDYPKVGPYPVDAVDTTLTS